MDSARTPRIAAEVRAEMARWPVSLNQLADLTGIPLSTLGRRTRGLSSFTIDEFYAVAQALEVDALDLLARSRDAAA